MSASILKQDKGVYKFRYKYIYYYFVAKYFSNKINEDEIRGIVSTLCGQIYIEESANIILFLTHHSKDPFVLEKILENSRMIFSEMQPIKFEKDIEEINTLIVELPKQVFLKTDTAENRKEKFRIQDSFELFLEEKEVASSREEIANEVDFEIDHISKLNFAMKTLEIIGQVLKNYYGSLDGEKKYELLEQSYLITGNGIYSTSY